MTEALPYIALALGIIIVGGVLCYMVLRAGPDDEIGSPYDDFNTAEQDPPAKFRREGKA